MTIRLIQSTASQEVPLGTFVDSTDGNTEKTALTIANTDIKLWKSGATTLASKNSGGATYISNGIYYCVLDATDTATLGPLVLFVHVATALPVRVECEVVTAAAYASATTGVLAADSIVAASISTGAYTALGDNVAAFTLDAFVADHNTATTFGAAIGGLNTSTVSANVVTLAAAVAALPLLAQIIAGLASITGVSAGGAASNELKLAVGATAPTAGMLAVIVGGAGVGQAQVILSYNAGTRVCTFADNWVEPLDASSQYALVRV